jgi:nitronate monooxygenase
MCFWKTGEILKCKLGGVAVKELIDRSMVDAEARIRQRLTGFLDGIVEPAPARAVA